LNRITVSSFPEKTDCCRQAVMPFVDRRVQLLTEAGRWVKGGTGKVKGSTIFIDIDWMKLWLN
jgi:hypothetical protein